MKRLFLMLVALISIATATAQTRTFSSEVKLNRLAEPTGDDDILVINSENKVSSVPKSELISEPTPQTLSIIDNELTISGGNTVTLPSAAPSSEEQVEVFKSVVFVSTEELKTLDSNLQNAIELVPARQGSIIIVRRVLMEAFFSFFPSEMTNNNSRFLIYYPSNTEGFGYPIFRLYMQPNGHYVNFTNGDFYNGANNNPIGQPLVATTEDGLTFANFEGEMKFQIEYQYHTPQIVE